MHKPFLNIWSSLEENVEFIKKDKNILFWFLFLDNKCPMMTKTPENTKMYL